MELIFSKEKDTPGTVRFKEESDDPKVGTLYVKKSTFAQLDNPETLKVTLEKVTVSES